MKEKQTQNKIVSCCWKCGIKKYKIKRDAFGITACIGMCPFCKENKPIIPASDWEFMMGDDSKWD